MSGIVNFIISVFKIAIFLAIMGDLTTTPKIMLHKAVNAHQHRGISFVQMNHALHGK